VEQFIISFASKGYCDATVAIEDASGRIVRHLVSGVLGPNAPAPFAKNSLSQRIVWDGKNDRGDYVEDRQLTARVSLGLRPSETSTTRRTSESARPPR
jgi:flagellar hook assembly protein FlgD